MSVQPPAAPHRVAIADIDIPFWRMVAIIIKWAFASIPAVIIISIIFAIIGAALGGNVAPSQHSGHEDVVALAHVRQRTGFHFAGTLARPRMNR